MELYSSLLVDKTSSKYVINNTMCRLSDIKRNELLIQVHYTSLNCRDIERITDLSGDKSSFIPGVDAAGVVVSSDSNNFKAGDEVIITGFGMGKSDVGGFSQYISIPSSWAIHIPIGMTMKQAAALGSAGIAAGLAAYRFIQYGITGSIAVYNASFDYGVIAAALFKKLNYNVTAYVDNTTAASSYLSKIGINDIVSNSALKNEHRNKGKALFNGVYSNYGDENFSKLLTYMDNYGIVAVSGFVNDSNVNIDLNTLIEKDVIISGLNEIDALIDNKEIIWLKYNGEWKLPIDWLCEEISIDQIPEYINYFVAKDILGRIVINMMV